MVSCSQEESLVVRTDPSARVDPVALAPTGTASAPGPELARSAFVVSGSTGIDTCLELTVAPLDAAQSSAAQTLLAETTSVRWPKGQFASGSCPRFREGRTAVATCTESTTRSLDGVTAQLSTVRLYYRAPPEHPTPAEAENCTAAGGKWKLLAKDDPIAAIQQFRDTARGTIQSLEKLVGPGGSSSKPRPVPSAATGSLPPSSERGVRVDAGERD